MNGEALSEHLKQVTEEDMPSTGAQGKMVKETPAKKKAEGSQCKEIVKVRFRAVRVGVKHRSLFSLFHPIT